jgi:hypothetical protein
MFVVSESNRSLTLETSVVRGSQTIETEIDGEVVALHLQGSAYYGFNKTGSRIWRMLVEPRRIGDICAELQRDFDVTPVTCEAQVLKLVAELYAEGLIAPVASPTLPAVA